jgi:uncharacterized protein Gcw-chp
MRLKGEHMKSLTKLFAVAALAGGTMMTSSVASAEVSYNIGFASEYYFRGILQKSSSASVGADYENSGFYIGTWAADVGDGLEVDGYFGYGIETDDGLSASIGFTGYYYTGEFDDTYQEINLNLGYSLVSFEYSRGQYDNFGDEVDYDFTAVTLELENGLYGKIGAFGLIEDEAGEGEYLELGYGTTISDIDLGIALIFSSDELSDQCDLEAIGCTGDSAIDSLNDTESEAIVFTIGKSF